MSWVEGYLPRNLMGSHAAADGKLVFAVCNTARMLKALAADYQNAW